MANKKLYDAFLSHNSQDKPLVEQIACWLEDEAKLKVWLDKWNLVPGDPWQEDLEHTLDQSRCCVVFLGPHGIGSWQNEEMRVAISKRVKQDMRIVPVLLPLTVRPEKESELPDFLRRLTWVKFTNNTNEADKLYELVCGIKGIAPGRGGRIVTPNVCPFRGLEVFREEHKDFFFGRENVVQRLQHYLQDHRFLAVIGPSGSGKSSVVQAGLLPTLKRAAQSSQTWKVALFTPKTDPFEGLAFALRPFMTQPPSYSQFIKDLADNEKELEYIARGICRETSDARLLLVIDQFEEVFTQTVDKNKRERFFASLLNTVETDNCPTLIVLTMRSDFLGKCAAYADLNTFVIEHLFQIGPMSAKDLREAIEEPAHRVGLEFEKGLVEIMLRDAAGAPGELPLIEHTLLELYDRRGGNQLTQAAYVEIGGISGALAKRADAEFARLTPVQQDILRKMFVLRLIQPGEGTEDTRRRATKEELLAVGGNAKEAETVLQQWTNARLLTTTRDDEKTQEIVDVAHEALIRTWPKVQDWLKEARETSRLLGLVRHTVQEWLASGKSADHLWQGAPLTRAEELYAKNANDLTLAEKEFIKQGIARRDHERQKELEHERQLKQALDESKQRSAQIYWEYSRQAREEGNLLLSLHWLAEAGQSAPAQNAAEVFIQDGAADLQAIVLKNILPHRPCICGARFDSTGMRILTWGLDGTARLWRAETGKLINQPMKHKREVNGAIFDQAQERILTWSDDGTARLWEAETGKALGRPMKHEAHVNGAMFDEAQERILTWCWWDGTARLWEAKTGKLIGRPMQHEGDVHGAIFDQVQERILTWSKDGTARLWEAKTGKLINQPMKHEREVSGAIFDQAQLRILTWSEDSTACLWKAESGKLIGQPMKHEKSVNGATFDKAQKRILTWSDDGTARLWEAGTGKLIGQPMKHEKDVDGIMSIKGAMFDQSQERILTWGWDAARLWEAETGELIGQPMKHETSVYGAIFDPAQKRILTWSQDGTARLWETETGELVGQPMKHENYVKGAAFDKAQKRILTWSKDGTARLWKVGTGQPIGQPMWHEHEESVYGAMFDQSQERILTWGSDAARLWEVETGEAIKYDKSEDVEDVKGAVFDKAQKRILTWGWGMARLREAETGKLIGQPMKHKGKVNGAIFDQAQERILTWDWDGEACLWEAETGRCIGGPMYHEGEVNGAIFDQAQERILTWSKDGTARLWRVETGWPIGQPMKHEKSVNGAVFDKAQKRILTWSDDGTARLWKVETGQSIGQCMRHNYEKCVLGAMFGPTHESILTWSDDGTARLWKAKTGRPIGKPLQHGDDIRGAMFDPAHERILTWGLGGGARLWEAGTGQPIGQPMRHESLLNGATFDPAQKRILTWSEDGTARLWEAETGKALGQPMTHEKSVRGAVFDKTQKYILTWSEDGTVRLWDAETGKPLGQPMKHEYAVLGALFDHSQRRILTWSVDGTMRLWNIPGDLDFPHEFLVLQVQVLTGTKLDLQNRQISVIPTLEWQALQKQYLALARKHTPKCQNARQNLYLRLWGRMIVNSEKKTKKS